MINMKIPLSGFLSDTHLAVHVARTISQVIMAFLEIAWLLYCENKKIMHTYRYFFFKPH